MAEEPRQANRFLTKAVVVFAVVTSSFFVQSTLAGNISLNSSSSVEFGQGTTQLLACSGSTAVVVSPIASFANASQSGAFNLSGIKISNIPQSCFGSQFTPTVATTTMSRIVVQSSTAPSELLAVAGIPTSGLRYGTVGGSPTGWLTMSTGFTPGTTWTVDGWVKGSNMAVENTIVMVGQGTTNACNALTLRSLSSNSWSLDLSCIDRINFTMPSGSMANNTWIHVAAVGDTNGMSIWVNGQALSKTQCGACTNTGSGIRFTNSYTSPSTQIGAWSGNGWISQGGVMNYLRLSTSAIWPSTQSTIPVPSSPPTAIASTKLLLTSTSTSPFVDSSALNQTLTRTGTVAATS